MGRIDRWCLKNAKVIIAELQHNLVVDVVKKTAGWKIEGKNEMLYNLRDRVYKQNFECRVNQIV